MADLRSDVFGCSGLFSGEGVRSLEEGCRCPVPGQVQGTDRREAITLAHFWVLLESFLFISVMVVDLGWHCHIVNRTDGCFCYLEQELLEKGEKNGNVTLGVLATIPVLLFTVLLSLFFGKKSAPSVSRLPRAPLS